MLVEYRKPQFIYPKGKIRFLELDDVIEKVQLKSGSMLVLIGINALCWDSKNMQAGVKVSHQITSPIYVTTFVVRFNIFCSSCHFA